MPITQKHILEVWKESADRWKKIDPNHRPSEAEIQLFERFLVQVLKSSEDRTAKALVLGATPEIRDLLAQHQVSVTLLDANELMIRAMTELIRLPNPDEKPVIGNWLHMPFSDDEFDLVIGDHPTSSISPFELKKFFSEIFRVLRNPGYLIVDLHINANLPAIGLNDYISTYRSDRNWFSDFNNKLFTQYKVVMGDKEFYDPETYRSEYGKFDRRIRELFEADKLTKDEKQALTVGLGEDYVFHFYPKEMLRRMLSEKFEILNEEQLNTHPIYQYYWPCFARTRDIRKAT